MNKIIEISKLVKIKEADQRRPTTVLATGVFDILHVEHVRFLKKAKVEGDILIVGIEPDVRVKKLKGSNRPINKQADRLEVLASLSSINYVFVLPNNLSTPEGRERLISKIAPDIYAVSEHTPYLKEKQRIMKLFGGKLKVIHKYNPHISSSIVLNAKSKENE